MAQVLVKDLNRADELIQESKRKGTDRYDEVWDGVYVMPSMPTLEHQELVHDLDAIFDEVIKRPGLGKVCPGVNVSDRGPDWKKNYRIPDVVVVLKDSRVVRHKTHLQGGPDFLVEIESPGDDSKKKIPFYEQLRVRELLLIHRDKRTLRLLRLNGQEFVRVPSVRWQGKRWLVSTVLPLAFRRTWVGVVAHILVLRTDGKSGLCMWIV